MKKDISAGIYICQFSDGTIKVGRSNDVDLRIASHKTAGKCFGISMLESAVIPCFNLKAAEHSLIAWCMDHADSVSCREWFKGLNYQSCVSHAKLVATSHMGPHKLRGVKAKVFDILEGFSRPTAEQSAYKDGMAKFISVSNPPPMVIKAMAEAHRRCELVRHVLSIGGIAPGWYEELNILGPWESELLLSDGKPDAELFRAIADSLEVA